jgi:arylsulfatase A-like enzyme
VVENHSGSTRVARAGQLLTIAAAFGLAFGLLEAVILLGLQESGLAAWQWIRDGVAAPILWVSPAFNLVLYCLVSLLWAGAAVAFRRVQFAPWAAGFFAWMGFFALLAATGRLTDLACAVLSLGCGVRVAMWFRQDAERAMRSVQRALPCMALVCLLIGCAAALFGLAQEKILEPRQYAALPAAPANAPNILLIVMDTVRADHLSAYGYTRNTSPNFDRLAREGRLYRNAYSTASWTLPSHASMVTGLLPHEHGADMHPLRPQAFTLAEFLDERGYATAGFVANTIWCTRPAGFAQGFVHQEDYFGNWQDAVSRAVYSQKAMEGVLELFGVYRDITRKSAADVNSGLLAWLDRRGADFPNRPFFAFLNYFEAHEPVFPPAPYDALYGPASRVSGRVPIDYNASPPGSVSPQAQQVQIDAYDGAVAYMDAQLGALWSELERRGLAANTLLMVTADHGESLGEGGLYGHRSSLRLEQIHVPLLLRYPAGIAAGESVSQAVSLKQIPATVMDVAHFAGAPFPGRSLLLSVAGSDIATGEEIVSELTGVHDGGMPAFWPISAGDLRSLITPRWHYVERSDGARELYDLANDRAEQRNLTTSDQGRLMAAALGQQLGWRTGTARASEAVAAPAASEKTKAARAGSAPSEFVPRKASKPRVEADH